MNASNTEIEIRVTMSNVATFEAYLNTHAQYKKTEHQIDTYYNLPHSDSLRTSAATEWLRVRDADGVYSVNYKRWHFDEHGNNTYVDEYETDIANIDSMKLIFGVLELTQILVVDKVRKIWRYKDYEIALDTVKGLGTFVEVEYKGKTNADPHTITQGMIAFLKAAGCTDLERSHRGYPAMLMYPNDRAVEQIP